MENRIGHTVHKVMELCKEMSLYTGFTGRIMENQTEKIMEAIRHYRV